MLMAVIQPVTVMVFVDEAFSSFSTVITALWRQVNDGYQFTVPSIIVLANKLSSCMSCVLNTGNSDHI